MKLARAEYFRQAAPSQRNGICRQPMDSRDNSGKSLKMFDYLQSSSGLIGKLS
jgi:hypothetical protein